MQAKPTIEPAVSPVSGVSRSAASLRGRNPASTALAGLGSVIRGDKYMVDAYPPAWHSSAGARDGASAVGQNHDSQVAGQSVLAPAASQTKES
jgi:hypothetical protein